MSQTHSCRSRSNCSSSSSSSSSCSSGGVSTKLSWLSSYVYIKLAKNFPLLLQYTTIQSSQQRQLGSSSFIRKWWRVLLLPLPLFFLLTKGTTPHNELTDDNLRYSNNNSRNTSLIVYAYSWNLESRLKKLETVQQGRHRAVCLYGSGSLLLVLYNSVISTAMLFWLLQERQ